MSASCKGHGHGWISATHRTAGAVYTGEGGRVASHKDVCREVKRQGEEEGSGSVARNWMGREWGMRLLGGRRGGIANPLMGEQLGHAVLHGRELPLGQKG